MTPIGALARGVLTDGIGTAAMDLLWQELSAHLVYRLGTVTAFCVLVGRPE